MTTTQRRLAAAVSLGLSAALALSTGAAPAQAGRLGGRPRRDVRPAHHLRLPRRRVRREAGDRQRRGAQPQGRPRPAAVHPLGRQGRRAAERRVGAGQPADPRLGQHEPHRDVRRRRDARRPRHQHHRRHQHRRHRRSADHAPSGHQGPADDRARLPHPAGLRPRREASPSPASASSCSTTPWCSSSRRSSSSCSPRSTRSPTPSSTGTQQVAQRGLPGAQRRHRADRRSPASAPSRSATRTAAPTATTPQSQASALRIEVTAGDRRQLVELGTARVRMGGPAPVGVFRSGGTAMDYQALQGALKFGNVEHKALPCQGTRGRTQTYQVPHASPARPGAGAARGRHLPGQRRPVPCQAGTKRGKVAKGWSRTAIAVGLHPHRPAGDHRRQLARGDAPEGRQAGAARRSRPASGPSRSPGSRCRSPRRARSSSCPAAPVRSSASSSTPATAGRR